MTIPGFVIRGQARTKKNSPRVITIPTKGARRCHACGHMPGFPKVLPSEAYETWEQSALRECLVIMPALRARGIELPITAPISVEALIYLEPRADGQMRMDVGDVSGFIDAIGDMLQACGIIANDRQIEHWDGTRRLLDRDNPRVEIYIETLGSEMPTQEVLNGVTERGA